MQFYVNTRRKNNKLQGEITKVLKRNKTEYVGIIQVNKNFAFVIPDNRKINIDIYQNKFIFYLSHYSIFCFCIMLKQWN